ncbi:hypothetical protein KP509_29G069900 [Ceratopteris richardii]|uniref:Uncharacterized protein n=1 Tax=Ceratopteris richardii TaxID=49495 RepID=A0A8T2R969_CERRI|nr:hypothetical protein KP509_29G069900 [Ceratopteris richardii]
MAMSSPASRSTVQSPSPVRVRKLWDPSAFACTVAPSSSESLVYTQNKKLIFVLAFREMRDSRGRSASETDILTAHEESGSSHIRVVKEIRCSVYMDLSSTCLSVFHYR